MPHRRSSLSLLAPGVVTVLVTALVVGTFSLLGWSSAGAATTGSITGTVANVHGSRLSGIEVRVFRVTDGSWAYLRTLKATTRSGGFTADDLEPGRYVLQAVDTRPAYDKTKKVTTDARATVPAAGGTVTKNVFMHVGASLYGTATRHGRTAPSTTVRAVRDGDTTGTVYAVRSDDRGRYLLGGLPVGTYTVFPYDHSKTWTGKVRRSTLKAYGRLTRLDLPMSTRAGRYTGAIRAGGLYLSTTVYVTAVNRTTGQFWVVKVSHGKLSLRGLSPGSYTLKVPGADRYLGRTFTLKAIRAGRTTKAGFLDLTRQGGLVTGTIVDATTSTPLPGVEVTINDKYGHPYETVQTDSRGFFSVGGSIPNGDGPASITIRARSTINGVRYQDGRNGPIVVKEGTTTPMGSVGLERVPTASPTTAGPTTTAPSATPTPTATASTTAP